MHRRQLQSLLDRYELDYPSETIEVVRFRKLISDHVDCFERTCMPGHITSSAWVTDPNQEKVILVHHRKLDIWVQPGGHCDGQSDVLQSSLREVHEETGMRARPVLGGNIFDLDIHRIPARKDEPEHWHYDVRFLLEVDSNQSLQISEESHDVRWVPLKKLGDYSSEASILRMKSKLEETL